jgi:hypothetical protein
MKKGLALPVIVCMALALVASCAGCGGGENEADKASARELMQTGDTWMEEVEADYETISTLREEMRESRSDAGEGGDEAETQGNETDGLMEEVQSAAESMSDSLQKAEEAYQGIVSLGGAGGYKDYANVMLELISLYEQVASIQGEMQQRSEGEGPAALPEGGTPPSDMTPLESGTPPPGMTPPEDGELPSGMTPPEGGFPPEGGGGLAAGGLFEQIEELKAEAEAIKEENNL